MSSSWTLWLAGAPRLVPGADSPARELALSRKDAAWLAAATRQGGATPRQVALLVWPDAGERGALNSLHQRVHRLRKATGARLVEVGERIAPAADLHVPQPDIAALVAADVETDPGTLLAGHDYDAEPEFAAWLAHEREAEQAALREALAAQAAAAEQQGELAGALRCAERLLALDPLSEHAHRRLMRLHYLRGDRAAAVAAFERCERELKDELGLAPEAETLALLATVEQGRGGARAAVQPLPAGLARPPRLVGRDAALAELAAALQAGEACVVVGEAGMGKSRLLHEALAGRSDALLVQARPGDAAQPYALLMRLLPALRSRLGEVGGEDGGTGTGSALALLDGGPDGHDGPATPTTTRALQAALVRLLVQAQAAGLALLAADDLHFADPASLDMLLALMPSEALAGLRWVLAQRPLASLPEPGALQLLAEAPQLRWLHLQPLDAAQLHELVASLALPRFDPAALAPALLRHTGGNPLFAVETLRAAWLGGGDGRLALPRPQGLAHLIDARLARLSRPALALARVAAVAVPDFSLELAESVLGASALALADAWQELEAAQVLQGEGFAHDLVHDATQRATPAVIAARTHRQVAAFLAGRGAEPARVAAHWEAGAAWFEAGAAYRAAAARAKRAGRLREQAQLLQAGAAAFDHAGQAETGFEMRCEAVGVLLPAQGAAAALALSERLVDACDPVAEPAAAARALAAHGEACIWGGRFADAEAAARRALALAASDDEATRMTASAAAAQACGLQGRPDDGLTLLLPWAERIATWPSPSERNGLVSALINLLIQADQPASALPWSERWLRWAEEASEPSPRIDAHTNLGAALLRCGDLDAALAHARAASQLGGATAESAGTLAWNATGLAFMLVGQGHYDEALALFERELAASAGQPGPLRELQRFWCVPLWLCLGQSARALALLAEEGGGAPSRPGRPALARALVARALGEDDRPWLQEALASLTAPVARFDWMHARLQLAHHHETPTQALASADELAPLAEARAYRAVQADIEAVRVQALVALGRGDEAAAAAASLEALALRWRYPLQYLPEQLLTAVAGYRAGGREDDARRCLRAALRRVHEQALPHVPPPFVESFLHRNRVNARLRNLLAAKS